MAQTPDSAHQTMELDRDWFDAQLLDRFQRYVAVHTTPDRHSESTPSTDRQFELARMLVEELRAIGVSDIYFDDQCYVIARLPATTEGAESVGLMAHLDTSPDTSGENVQPLVHAAYDGGTISLPGGTELSPEENPDLVQYRGETIITSDGSTLLGADDKAGVAEIMTAVAYLQDHPEIPHGQIEIIFTPDEEIGKGMDHFPVSELRSLYCYTIDGGEEGGIEAECFNAYLATVRFQGHVIHPGSARGRLVNANTMAATFLSMVPRTESPEATDGRYGFYCPIEVKGDMNAATVELIVRDFTMSEVQRRLTALQRFAEAVESEFPGGRVEVDATEQYRNMYETLSHHPAVLETLEQAIRDTGMEPFRKVIRGGTDGARLTQMGIPTPNVFAGAHNMHGVHEWVALPTMVRAAKSIVNLARLWASPR
jgi:tripeptide aminopeptidase